MLCQTCSIEGFPTLKTLDSSSKAVFHISKCLLFIMSSRYNQRSYSFSQAVSINRPTPPLTPQHTCDRSLTADRMMNVFYESNECLPVLHCMCY